MFEKKGQLWVVRHCRLSLLCEPLDDFERGHEDSQLHVAKQVKTEQTISCRASQWCLLDAEISPKGGEHRYSCTSSSPVCKRRFLAVFSAARGKQYFRVRIGAKVRIGNFQLHEHESCTHLRGGSLSVSERSARSQGAEAKDYCSEKKLIVDHVHGPCAVCNFEWLYHAHGARAL